MVEKVNHALKLIILRETQQNLEINIKVAVKKATRIYNRTPKPSGYSPFFLLFGTAPLDQVREDALAVYTRDSTEDEQIQFDKNLVCQHEAPLARQRANGLKASRDQTRAYLQERKALIRIFAPGDWVLRVRQCQGKHEPFYDGPWAIASYHTGNVYTIRSPGGITLPSNYNGTNLFPAYSADRHPVRSFWYASKKMLEQDCKRISANAGLG